MRNTLSVFLYSALLIVSFLIIGCSGSGAGAAGAREGILSVSASVAAGPSDSQARFAATIREAPAASEASGTVGTSGTSGLGETRRYLGRILINGTPTMSTTVMGIDSTKTHLGFSANVTVVPGPVEYAVEILPASNSALTDPLFKGYFRTTVPNSQAASQACTLDASSTARALSYEEWKKRDDTNGKTIDEFIPNLEKLARYIQNQLDTEMSGGNTPGRDFVWNSTVGLEATRVASATPIPGSDSAPRITTGTLELAINSEWALVSSNVHNELTPPPVLGVTFFYLPEVSNYTLGNYYRYFPKPNGDDTRVIAYVPGASSLDDVAVAPSAWFHHALENFTQPPELAVGQVYAFHVNGNYGALLIIGLFQKTSITFNYKYNRNASETALE